MISAGLLCNRRYSRLTRSSFKWRTSLTQCLTNKANRRKGNMTEKELRFTCAYTDCGKETTVIARVSKPLAAQSKSVRRVYYCEHCNRANKIEVPDNVDVHVFILG